MNQKQSSCLLSYVSYLTAFFGKFRLDRIKGEPRSGGVLSSSSHLKRCVPGLELVKLSYNKDNTTSLLQDFKISRFGNLKCSIRSRYFIGFLVNRNRMNAGISPEGNFYQFPIFFVQPTLLENVVVAPLIV